MLECENLTVIYSNGVKALDNVNLKFSNTGLYYIIGHSGSINLKRKNNKKEIKE